VTASDKLKALLIEEEGKVRHAYADHLGFLTIGIGRLIDERKGGGLSDDEIDYLLTNDIRKAEAFARTYPWFDGLSWERQAVIVMMIFQLGATGLNAFVKMRQALERGDFDTAAAEALDSKWAREDTPARARRMANILKTGVWPT
jgi:lysozyme